MIDTDIPEELVNADLEDLCVEFLDRYYEDAIAAAINEGHESLTIDHADLFQYNPDLAADLMDSPEMVVGHLETAAERVQIDVLDDHLADITIRVENATEAVGVSALRSEHKGRYMGVRGQVSQVTQVQPKATEITFRCERCSTAENDYTVGPIPQDGETIVEPPQCPSCERAGPFSIHDEEAVDHQIIELTDAPGETGGTTQHTVPVHVYGDACGQVAPGDRIQVNGLVTTKKDGDNSTRRPWKIKARAIDPEQVAFEQVEPERKDDIMALADEPDIIEKLLASIAPDIVGGDRLRQVKLAVLLQMFGGVRSEQKRGDIHLFLVGDKGTGKSQLLTRANELAPKSIKVSGKGATAAGLTATATQSDYGEGWMLDAGALVLADGGLACVDEFDKMTDSARKSMHEAMEDQAIPINKAGINTVLQSETAVLAAANPLTGDLDRFEKLHAQVNLEAPLLSRFDVIFAMMDSVDESRDRQIAKEQLRHAESEQPIPDDLLREYIAYARNNCHPEFASEAVEEELVDFYINIRQEASDDETGTSGIGPRVNDALRRLSEASARMQLSDEIKMADVERAKDLINRHIGDIQLEQDGGLSTTKTGHDDEGMRKRLTDALSDTPQYPSDLARETGLSEDKAREMLERMAKKGECLRQNGKYSIPL